MLQILVPDNQAWVVTDYMEWDYVIKIQKEGNCNPSQ